MDALFNWKRRALKAEQQLRWLGVSMPPLAFSDDEYLVTVLEHPDGREATVDEIKAAHERLAQGKV